MFLEAQAVLVCKAMGFFCLCSMNGALAFVDTSDCTMMNIAEHYTASDVEWDPTGRYIVTSVSWWSHKVLLHLFPYPCLLFQWCWKGLLIRKRTRTPVTG